MTEQPVGQSSEKKNDAEAWIRVALSTILTVVTGEAVVFSKGSEPTTHWPWDGDDLNRFERWLKRMLDPLTKLD